MSIPPILNGRDSGANMYNARPVAKMATVDLMFKVITEWMKSFQRSYNIIEKLGLGKFPETFPTFPVLGCNHLKGFLAAVKLGSVGTSPT